MAIRPNESYLGTEDSLIIMLRTKFPADTYASVEVGVRQGVILHADEQQAMGEFLTSTLACVVDSRHLG
jgi:hypothetical protein